MNFSLEGLNTKAEAFIPKRVVLKPPSKPITIPVIHETPIVKDWFIVMNDIFESCKRMYPMYSCKKRFTNIRRHPDPMKNTILEERQPSIHIQINSMNSYDFYYLDESIWVYCNVELGRGPLGSDLFHWSIENPTEIIGGIQRLIEFGGYHLKPIPQDLSSRIR